MGKVEVRAAFAYDADAVSRETGFACEGPSMTQQQFKEEVDINTIVERFGITGRLPENLSMPQSGDFTNVTDFHEAMNLVRQAEEEFLKVPAHVRARFNHDPGGLIAFLEEPGNRDEAIALGLIPKPVEVDRDGNPV